MTAATVHQFGCGRRHPQLGDKAPCSRQRHHAGDHRGRDPESGRVHEWADPGLLERAQQHSDTPPPTLILGGPVKTPEPGIDRPFGIDQVPGATYTADLQEVRPERPPSAGFWAFAAYIELVVVVLLAICGPAIIVGVYRWGF